jgi:Protein of unknown function (DUF998)
LATVLVLPASTIAKEVNPATEALLLAGAATAVVFLAILFIEGMRRPGYDPVYHTGSELELGERGWLQRASFLLMGTGVFGFATGVYETLHNVLAPVLLVVFGVGLFVAGLFVPDAVRGYPPGDPSKPGDAPTRGHQAHHLVGGPVAFLALFGACVTLAVRLDGAWRLYTALTAAAGLALTVATAVAYQRDAAYTGLVQRALIIVYWAWIILLGIDLAADPPAT